MMTTLTLFLAEIHVHEVHVTHSMTTAPKPVAFALLLIALSTFVVISFLINFLMKRARTRQFIEMFGVRVCRRCGANGPPHAMFCGKCGERVN